MKKAYIPTKKDIKLMKTASKLGLLFSGGFFLVLVDKIYRLIKCLKNNNTSIELPEVLRFGLTPGNIPVTQEFNASEAMSILYASQIITWTIFTFMFLLLIFIAFSVVKQYETFMKEINILKGVQIGVTRESLNN